MMNPMRDKNEREMCKREKCASALQYACHDNTRFLSSQQEIGNNEKSTKTRSVKII